MTLKSTFVRKKTREILDVLDMLSFEGSVEVLGDAIATWSLAISSEDPYRFPAALSGYVVEAISVAKCNAKPENPEKMIENVTEEGEE